MGNSKGWDPTTQTFVDGVDFTPVNFGQALNGRRVVFGEFPMASAAYWAMRAENARAEFAMQARA